MKALVKAHAKTGLWLQDVDKPEPGPEDVLIKVNEVAICGTDLHIYNWDQWAQEHVPVPMTIGHEYIGEIAEVGELVHSVKVGDRVHQLADLGDVTDVFVADRHRHRHVRLRPLVAVVDMQVGAADRDLVDLDQHVLRTGFGFFDLLQP